MQVRIPNREDFDQTTFSEAVWHGSTPFLVTFFGTQLVLQVDDTVKPVGSGDSKIDKTMA